MILKNTTSSQDRDLDNHEGAVAVAEDLDGRLSEALEKISELEGEVKQLTRKVDDLESQLENT